MSLLIYTVLLILCCALHSYLISHTVTTCLGRRLGGAFRYYRIFYNTISFATFLPLLYWGRGLDGPVLFTPGAQFWAARLILLACAGYLFVAGGRCYSLRQFLGIAQVRDAAATGALGERGSLRTTGVLGITRHPWYLGSLLLVWAAPGSFRAFTLLTSTVFSVYLILGSILEERKLLNIFGDEYRSYQARVSMLLPWRYLARMFRRSS